jgi:hypothetical protein
MVTSTIILKHYMNMHNFTKCLIVILLNQRQYDLYCLEDIRLYKSGLQSILLNVTPGFKDKTECITIYICQDQVP